MKKALIPFLSAAALMAIAAPAGAQEPSAAITAAVADGARPEADTARDELRKPAEIVAFAGVEPGDAVAELAPGSGYYTRILAKTVGPLGRVYAMVPPFLAERPGRLNAINALAAEYGNVTVVVTEFAGFTLEQPVDLVWTTENYHDFANGHVAAINASVFQALKPGGIYFVEDHSAPGAGLTVTSTLHRIDPQSVIEQVVDAGFVLEAQSDILANPDDPHDVGVRDPSVEGKTDKFALRFRKPE